MLAISFFWLKGLTCLNWLTFLPRERICSWKAEKAVNKWDTIMLCKETHKPIGSLLVFGPKSDHFYLYCAVASTGRGWGAWERRKASGVIDNEHQLCIAPFSYLTEELGSIKRGATTVKFPLLFSFCCLLKCSPVPASSFLDLHTSLQALYTIQMYTDVSNQI